MNTRRQPSRVEIGLSLAAAGAFVWILVGQQGEVTTAAQSNFMGGNPSRVDSEELRSIRLLFPAGSRSNWHTHSWGQLLMIEEGRGRTQVRGEPVHEMLPGQPWFTGAGIEHWHGAAPGEDALQMTIYEGTVDWMDPVSDDEYNVPPGQ